MKLSSRIFAIVLVIVLLGSMSVFAATEYWGNFSDYSAGLYSASHASYMYRTTTYAQARSIINSNSGSLPPGTMGVNPRAYNATSGTLIITGGWHYTSGTSVGYDVPVDVTSFPGYVYSQGMTALWNGVGYTTRSTTASPNAQFKSPSRSIQINAAGETFGSSAYAESLEDEPDLVLAEGVGGMVGYVKSSDLNSGAAKSPEEAAKSTIDKNTRFIPLYESDGKTVIGRFKIAPDTERIITIVD